MNDKTEWATVPREWTSEMWSAFLAEPSYPEGLCAALAAAPTPPAQGPIPMILHCPACGMQHIDAPEVEAGPEHPALEGVHATWTNPPHRSHLCSHCGHIWRPADVPTTGVQQIATLGKNDSPPVQEAQPVGVSCFVQPVPDHCDRIVWRNSYYHPPTPDAARRIETLEAERDRLQAQLDKASTFVELWEHAVAKGLITVHSARMSSHDPATRCSWIEGHDKAADISNAAADVALGRES